jgi:hypothetical protein
MNSSPWGMDGGGRAAGSSTMFYAVPVWSGGANGSGVGGGASGSVRRADLVTLQGHRAFLCTFIGMSSICVLIRDASLASFVAYLSLLALALYFLMVRLEPVAISLLIESSAASTAAAQ